MSRPVLGLRGLRECPDCLQYFKGTLAYQAHRSGGECADAFEMRERGMRIREGVWQVSVPASPCVPGPAITTDPLPGDSP